MPHAPFNYLLPALLISACATQAQPPAMTTSPADPAPLIGTDWTGTLTYMNYQEPFIDVTIPAALEVTETASGLELFFKYPDEPQANSRYELTYSDTGSDIDGKPLTERMVSETGATTLKTVAKCEDMGRAASCEMVYQISDADFIQTKFVTYAESGEQIRRNSYAFTR